MISQQPDYTDGIVGKKKFKELIERLDQQNEKESTQDIISFLFSNISNTIYRSNKNEYEEKQKEQLDYSSDLASKDISNELIEQVSDAKSIFNIKNSLLNNTRIDPYDTRIQHMFSAQYDLCNSLNSNPK